jgi:trigger factor
MASKLLSKEGNKAKIEIEISAEDFAKGCTSAYNKQAGKITVPGFRKGKAPKQVIENYYGADIFFDDAINEALPALYTVAIDELKLEPVDRPDIDVKEISAEKGAVVTVEVDCKPEVKLGKYMGISIPKIEHTFSDDTIEAELKQMQERNARVISADNKVLENGDIAVIDFEGFVGGVAFPGGKGENHSLELGSNSFIPGFEEQLVGKKNGETIDVKVTFPTEYHSEELAGKDATFTVTVNGIKTKELPKLDDEFAKDVSEFETLDELKASIRAKGEKDAETRQRRETEDAVIDAIIDNMEIDIPEAMIRDEIGNIAHNMDRHLSQQGLSLEQYFQMTGMSPETFIDEYRERAMAQVKANLMIEAVTKAEKIEATEEEIEAEYQKFIEFNPDQKIDDVKKMVPSEGIAHDICVRKTLDILIKSAKMDKKDK